MADESNTPCTHHNRHSKGLPRGQWSCPDCGVVGSDTPRNSGPNTFPVLLPADYELIASYLRDYGHALAIKNRDDGGPSTYAGLFERLAAWLRVHPSATLAGPPAECEGCTRGWTRYPEDGAFYHVSYADDPRCLDQTTPCSCPNCNGSGWTLCPDGTRSETRCPVGCEARP